MILLTLVADEVFYIGARCPTFGIIIGCLCDHLKMLTCLSLIFEEMGCITVISLHNISPESISK